MRLEEHILKLEKEFLGRYAIQFPRHLKLFEWECLYLSNLS